MTWFLGVGLVALLGVVAWSARRRSDAFVVRIERGRAELSRGWVEPGFVQGCSDVANLSRIVRGEVRGVRDGDDLVLRFSGTIPEAARQRFRNLWAQEKRGGGAVSRFPKRDVSERLLRLCRGDRALAERLIGLETKRAPDIAPEEAERRAVESLRRDNG